MQGLVERVLVQRTGNGFVQFIRSGIVAVAAFIVDFVGLILLIEIFNFHILAAASLSFIAGLLVNYWVSASWVFHSSKLSSQKATFFWFALIGLVGLGLTDLLLWALTNGLYIHYVLSKIIVTIVVYFWNFGARKKFLFY